MTANTTDHLQTLRKQVADVLERHQPRESVRKWVHGVPLKHTVCTACLFAKWPCDAVNQARQMTTLLDGLEFYADESNYNPDDVICSEPRDWGHTGMDVHQKRPDRGMLARQVIASAAQEQEDDSE